MEENLIPSFQRQSMECNHISLLFCYSSYIRRSFCSLKSYLFGEKWNGASTQHTFHLSDDILRKKETKNKLEQQDSAYIEFTVLHHRLNQFQWIVIQEIRWNILFKGVFQCQKMNAIGYVNVTQRENYYDKKSERNMKVFFLFRHCFTNFT